MASMIARCENDWRRAHEELSRLAQLRARLDFDEGRWMLQAERARVHTELGHATFTEYIERLFGYDAQSTREKLRVASALEKLPALCRALSDAEVSWSAVRELSRVATSETEAEWLEAARGQTVREIEKQVSGRKPGDRPADPPDPAAERHVLRFEVSAATMATFREAMTKLRHEADSALDDDAALLLMARHVLGGPTDEGRASYQILVDVCEQCGRGRQQSGGQEVTLEPEALAMAKCDAQRLAISHVGHEHGTDKRDKTQETRTVTNTKPWSRATQEIPPAVRREVMRRDRGCCVVPGCRNTRFVDAHHLELRSEGGNHDPDGLIVLCSAHHRAAHAGKIIIEGRVRSGLVFRHADGRVYGERVCAAAVELWMKAFQALRNLGFRETDSRRALNELRTKAENVSVAPTIERVVREAILVLT